MEAPPAGPHGLMPIIRGGDLPSLLACPGRSTDKNHTHDPASAATVDGDKEIGRCRFLPGGERSSFPCRSGDQKNRGKIPAWSVHLRPTLLCDHISDLGRGVGARGRWERSWGPDF